MIDFTLLKGRKEAKKSIIYNVISQLISLCLSIAIIYMFSKILSQSIEHLYFNAILIIGLIILKFLSLKAANTFSYKSSEEIKILLRSKIFDKVSKLGDRYKESISTAELIQISVEGIEQLDIYFSKYVPQLFYSLLSAFILFLFVSTISFKIAIILFLGVPLIPLSIILVQKIAKKILKKYWDDYTTLGDIFLDSIKGLNVLKAYQSDEYQNKKINDDAERFRKTTMKVLIMQLNSISVMDIVAYGGTGIGIILSLISFDKGAINLEGTIAIILLSSEFFIPMRLLGSFFHIAMNGKAASEKINKFLSVLEESEEKSIEVEEIKEILINIEEFGYTSDEKVLENIKYSFKKGLTAIVGESGSGKSTIASIIQNNYTDYKGEILINGRNINSISNVKNKITILSNNSYIFKGSIKENLLMGNKNASEKELVDVLKQVSLNKFIKGNTINDIHILSGGNNLSGGEKQRLAIARVLLKKQEVLIFDEATSNVDRESEEIINKIIKEISKEKIVISITHNILNVKDNENIIVLEKGNLVECGSHEKLSKEKGIYYKLLQKQIEQTK